MRLGEKDGLRWGCEWGLEVNVGLGRGRRGPATPSPETVGEDSKEGKGSGSAPAQRMPGEVGVGGPRKVLEEGEELRGVSRWAGVTGKEVEPGKECGAPGSDPPLGRREADAAQVRVAGEPASF